MTQRSSLCRLLLPAVALSVGCAAKIDKITVQRVVQRAQQVPDVDQACQIGTALRSPLAAATKEHKPAHRALLIAEVTAGMCDEVAAWEHELAAEQALSPETGHSPQERYALARDARLRSDRAHARAAARYARALAHGEAAFGPLGGDCPDLKDWEELPYLLTLVAGLQTVLHDSAAGSPLGVPKEGILGVARSAECMDNATWWSGPAAMQAAAWATIPGSGPEGVDPWAVLAESAAASDSTGVRVARGLQVTIAANAGQGDVLRDAIVAHAAALGATPTDAEYALFDRYAFLLSQHQSDLLWMKEAGHRTSVFGELPGQEPAAGAADPSEQDPFGGDPFGGDPFGSDASGGDPTDDAAGDPNDAPPPGEAEPTPGKEDE